MFLLVIFFELWTVGTLHCSRWYVMLPFFRDLMKAVKKELNTGQHHQATQTLVRAGLALSQIRLQTCFKNIVILGGVEQTLMAMQKVISLLGKKTLSESAIIDDGLV